ncbi:MAG: DNA mismatch repair endonuclease MutL [Candidatus Aureabacteria bacterium]|nr:DNA mismatch repair endonuclease MutL [Candidatus Auribacterota bacterium]
MPKIRILEKNVISRIAAGEIIERPSSVVKELIENSIDSGAEDIQIEIEDAGKSLILVQDNGCGMSEEDLKLSLERHATSKICDDSDLFRIRSFGFRGEALPSIASVSRMSVSTSEDTSGEGWQIRCDYGKKSPVKKVSHPRGTTIRIENLFDNVPVRKKFLKSDLSEKRSIQNIVDDFAAANTSLSFQLQTGGQITTRYPSVPDKQQRYKDILGEKIFTNMKPLSYTSSGISVSGLISVPDFVRGDRTRIKFFVNRRAVVNSDLIFSLVKFFSDKIPGRHYPYAMVFIDIDPFHVDVNIHPTKREVKFKNPHLIFSMLLKAYTLALSGSDAHSFSGTKEALFSRFIEYPPKSTRAFSFNLTDETPSTSFDMTETLFEGNHAQEELPFCVIGQIGMGYILLEKEGGIEIIDQHAAHERILYEKLKKRMEEKTSSSQDLLIPDVIEMDEKDAEILRGNLEGLRRIGFVIEPFGKISFKVDAVPVEFCSSDTDAFFHRYAGFISEEAASSEVSELEKIFRAACRSAVMTGDRLSLDEMNSLVTALYHTQNRYTCPHGRPIIKPFSWKEIQKFFGRR